MKRLFFWNFVIKILFLLLTPTLFRALNFAFIWQSIYWGTVTFVVLIWGVLILLSPLFGRIGCGWICFMGTIQDFTSQRSVFTIKWKKPLIWLRLLNICAFFTVCRNLFFMGALCASGASISRLIPVVDAQKCIESCKPKAIEIKFVWNRNKYIKEHSQQV